MVLRSVRAMSDSEAPLALMSYMCWVLAMARPPVLGWIDVTNRDRQRGAEARA